MIVRTEAPPSCNARVLPIMFRSPTGVNDLAASLRDTLASAPTAANHIAFCSTITPAALTLNLLAVFMMNSVAGRDILASTRKITRCSFRVEQAENWGIDGACYRREASLSLHVAKASISVRTVPRASSIRTPGFHADDCDLHAARPSSLRPASPGPPTALWGATLNVCPKSPLKMCMPTCLSRAVVSMKTLPPMSRQRLQNAKSSER